MSISYGPLASWYDRLTGDVPYEAFLAFYEAEFAKAQGGYHTVLDLCCGTGTLTWLMAERGYEMIACDASPDMLMQATGKAADAEIPPLFLCQEASELDLFGTVDAAVCSLDGMDYIPPEELGEVFRRLHLFVRPYGLVIFDIRTPDWFRSIDGEIFVDESEDTFGRISATTVAADSGHARVVPAIHYTFFHKDKQISLGEECMGEI